MGSLGTVRGFNTVGVLYASGANALARSRVMLRHRIGISKARSGRGHVLHRTCFGDCFRAKLGGLVSHTVLSRIGRLKLRSLDDSCGGISRVPFSFAEEHVSIIMRSEGNGQRVVAGKTMRRVLAIYDFTRFNKGIRPLSSDVQDGTREFIGRVGTRNVEILTLTRGDFLDGRGGFTVRSRGRVILVNCLTFLSPPGRSTSRTVGRLRRRNIRIGILSNSGRTIMGTVSQRMKVGASSSIAKPRLRGVDRRTGRGTIMGYDVFSGLAPVRGSRVVRLLRGGGGAINFLNSKVGSTTTLQRSSVKVSMSSTMSVTGRDTSVVLLRGSLVILRGNMLRNEGAFKGVIGCIGVATDSGFKGVFDMLTTDSFLPFLPVLPVRLLVRGLLCSVSRAAVPFSHVSERCLTGPYI